MTQMHLFLKIHSFKEQSGNYNSVESPDGISALFEIKNHHDTFVTLTSIL